MAQHLVYRQSIKDLEDAVVKEQSHTKITPKRCP